MTTATVSRNDWRRARSPSRGLLLCVIALSFAPPCLPMSAPALPAVSCDTLADAQIDAASIGLPSGGAQVTSAQMSAPGDLNGRYCTLIGKIAAVGGTSSGIRFQVNLPSSWNRKAVQMGGGGYDGVLVTGLRGAFLGVDGGAPVARGYVTFGSDSGHTTETMPGTAAFALNEQALDDFAGDQLKKVHDVAAVLLQRYYGHKHKRMYFLGNSQGGHEGLLALQRWPGDYDGVVAIHPAFNFAALQLSGLHLGQTVYRTPGSWISPEKLERLGDSIVAACDALDGLRDGVIANLKACRNHFDPETLRCGSGPGDSATCFSDEQMQTLAEFDRPTEFGFTLSGLSQFPRWPLLDGAFAASTTAPIFGLGTVNVPTRPPGTRDAFVFFMADQFVRYLIMGDENADSLRFDPRLHREKVQEISRRMDASTADLDSFRARGGKLLLMHGTVDMAISPYNTIAYYRQLQRRYPQQALEKFVKFYLVPGFGHGDGAFQVAWDSLTALDNWVDRGRAPSRQTVRDTATATAGRARPLCEYPAWPRYQAGDERLATSFRCVDE